MTRYYFDTEFIEDGKTIDLISIGIVAEDGREYYACNDECDLSKASQWVKDNVLPLLPSKHIGINPGNPDVSPKIRQEILTWKTRNQIANEIAGFCGCMTITTWQEKSPNFWFPFFGTHRPVTKFKVDENMAIPEFWAYYADYDWVVFCQLFGTMMDLPEGFPMYCRDLKQEADRLGIDLSNCLTQKNEHNALDDARWNKIAHQVLMEHEFMKVK